MLRRLLLVLVPALALAQSAPEFMVPNDMGVINKALPTANTLYCWRPVMGFTLTNGTTLACPWPAGTGGSTSACAIYADADAGALLASCNHTTTSAGTVLCTGISAFTLTAGTRYRVCVCSTSTSVQYLAVGRNTNTGHGYVPALLLKLDATTVGTGANACPGSAPSTTGALTAPTIGTNDFAPPIMRVGGGS